MIFKVLSFFDVGLFCGEIQIRLGIEIFQLRVCNKEYLIS